MLGAECSLVLLSDPERGTLVVRGYDGWSTQEQEFLRVLEVPHDTDSVISEWVDTPVPMLVDVEASESEYVWAILTTLGLRFAAVVPIRRHGALMGSVVAGFRADVPRDLDGLLERSAALAEYAATVIENARLLEQVRHQATHDELTGLPNRSLFEDAARRALAHSQRSDEPVALLFVDLDGFKAVNDQYGHGAGDLVLTEVAAARSGPARRRHGRPHRWRRVHRLAPGHGTRGRKRGRGAAAPGHRRPDPVHPRRRAGVGVHRHRTAPDDATAYKDLVRAADSAMYRAKRDGRDQCVRFEAA